MQYLSYLEGIAQIRTLTGLAHHAQVLVDLGNMLSAGHFALLDIGQNHTRDGRAYRAIFLHNMCTVDAIAFRDSQIADVRADGIRLQGGPMDLPKGTHFPPVVLGAVECSAESSEIALNFARPFTVRLEVRAATRGEGAFVLLFAIEYSGRLLRCKSSPVRACLDGAQQILEFEVPEVTTVDPEVEGFLESATFVKLSSVYFALGTQLADERVTLQSNWAFGFLPAKYVS